MKTILLIDGQNFKNYIKYSLNENNNDVIWSSYNFKGLFDLVLNGYEINKVIFYFAKIKKHEKTEKKSLEKWGQSPFLKILYKGSNEKTEVFSSVFSTMLRG